MNQTLLVELLKQNDSQKMTPMNWFFLVNQKHRAQPVKSISRPQLFLVNQNNTA